MVKPYLSAWTTPEDQKVWTQPTIHVTDTCRPRRHKLIWARLLSDARIIHPSNKATRKSLYGMKSWWGCSFKEINVNDNMNNNYCESIALENRVPSLSGGQRRVHQRLRWNPQDTTTTEWSYYWCCLFTLRGRPVFFCKFSRMCLSPPFDRPA